MKLFNTIPLLVILAAAFSTCKKETVTVVDSVFVNNQTLTLAATRDASIFSEDVPSNPGYIDNGAGASDLLRVGYQDDNNVIMRTLIGFDISSLPANAVIVSATLSLTLGKSGNTPPGVSVYKLNQDWTEGTTDDGCEYAQYNCATPGTAISSGSDVTWSKVSSTASAWTTPGGTFAATASASVKEGGIPTFTSDALVTDINGWRTTPSSNFGWLLKVDEDALAGSGGEAIRYLSREASTNKPTRTKAGTAGADPVTKPTLTIVYHL